MLFAGIRVWLADKLDPPKEDWVPRDNLVDQMLAEINYLRDQVDRERRRNLKLNRMIYNRYGLSTPYGEHSKPGSNTPEKTYKPVARGKPYIPLHNRRESLEQQSKDKVLEQEREKIKGNWKGKIEVGPDIRNLPVTKTDNQDQESKDDLDSLD